MIKFEQLTLNELEEAAIYIAELNTNKKHHIGYCGTVKTDILNDLHEDFVSNDEVAVYVLRKNEEIIGLIGFDTYDGVAEVWGPFSSDNNIDYQLQLWHFATQNLADIEEFLFFINEENSFQQQFMQMLQAEKNSEELYLFVKKEDVQPVKNLQSIEFNETYYDQFEVLHSTAFPNAYYTAKTIVEKLNNPNNELLLLTENDVLKGYVYTENNYEIHSIHIDFFAIAPDFRGQGLGELLLTEALTRSFANESITRVTLTVNNANHKANNLYYKTGFQKKDVLISYILKN